MSNGRGAVLELPLETDLGEVMSCMEPLLRCDLPFLPPQYTVGTRPFKYIDSVMCREILA